jgi:hypothetical protein
VLSRGELLDTAVPTVIIDHVDVTRPIHSDSDRFSELAGARSQAPPGPHFDTGRIEFEHLVVFIIRDVEISDIGSPLGHSQAVNVEIPGPSSQAGSRPIEEVHDAGASIGGREDSRSRCIDGDKRKGRGAGGRENPGREGRRQKGLDCIGRVIF